MKFERTISTFTAIRSIRMAKRDSDGYRSRKYITLKSILFIMFANLKLVLRSYTSLYGIFMSACLTLFIYNEGFYISYKQVKMAYSLPRVYAVFCVTDVSKITRRFYISYKQVKMTNSLPRVYAVFCGRFIITLN